MDDSKLERLVNQCRSNDVDVKIDAIAKLQVEFEAGIEITDSDALLTVFKSCLRVSNQHLTTAVLSALPPLLPLLITRTTRNPSTSTSPAASTSSVGPSSLIDVYTLRQALVAFLPSGGVIDRLGDAREKPREKARETLLILGGMAFRSGSGSAMSRSREGKGPETPLMIFERFLKEVGFASKVWRIREQCILTLVHIRRAHHMFPIRPYLPQLIGLLEDMDGNVRECARQSVVELFTSPAVTDAARSDLKKELTKKGVRKAIVDGVLSQILQAAAGSPATPTSSEGGNENGDGGRASGSGYVPPSIALMNKRPSPVGTGNGIPKSSSQASMGASSRPASRAAALSPDGAPPPGGGGSEVKPVYIVSSRDLEGEFASMLKHFEGKETEHNWAPREKAVLRVRGMLKGDVYERFTETFLSNLKPFIDASIKTLVSLRTTVASNTCSLYCELAVTLGPALDPCCDTLYHNLLNMANLTKKIIAQQSQATVDVVISHTSAQPRLVVPLMWNILQDKAAQPRTYALSHIKSYLEAHGANSKHIIESSGAIDTLEKAVKKGLGDPSPLVRDVARKVFWSFDRCWRERARVILGALDSMSRKQLEKACPDPEVLAQVALPPTTPKVKKSSVAATIAASRARAKQIATAPPTLRHQATSAARTTSPPSNKRPVSPALSSSSSAGGRAASPVARLPSSSSSPRARVVSAGALSRSTNNTAFVPTAHHREYSRARPPASPPSPTPDPSNRRRVSSPLVAVPPSNSNSVLRRAVQTALPASPPSKYAAVNTSPTPRPQRHATPPPTIHRESLSIEGLHTTEESLLLAAKIPVPDGDDSDLEVDMDIDESLNLISFSTPYEVYPPPGMGGTNAKSAASFSPRSTSSKPGLSNALSTATSSSPTGTLPQPMVEDAMRARAEQAESAAQRLLELVEPEEDGVPSSPLPPSLLLGTPEATPKVKARVSAEVSSHTKVTPGMPRTPVRNSSSIMRQAAQFQDSPAYKPSSTSLFDMIDTKNNCSEWWTKRKNLVDQSIPFTAGEPSDRREELNGYIAQLEQGSADTRVLKKLAILCRLSPVNEPLSPISPALSDPASQSPVFGLSRSLPFLKSDLWTQGKLFDRTFDAVIQSLDPAKSAADLEYGLIVLWEMLENQAPLIEGREADIFAALLRIRYCGQATVMQATNDFRDALTTRIEPVYGLTTMHASIRAFRDSPLPLSASPDTKDGTYAFGLIALGKFMLRLPAEVLEDELPRLRATLTSALTDESSESSTVVREAAAASIIAAQIVIQDETHIFALLDGLPDDKKNLLAYLFDKHSSKGSGGANGQSAVDKLEREIRRLDSRTSLAPRPSLSF